MITKTRWRPIAAVLTAGLIVAACGADEESGSTEPAAAEAGTEETEAGEDGEAASTDFASEDCPIPDGGGVTIDVLGWEFPITAQYARELEACEDAGGYTVNVQLLDSASARDQATLDVSTGSPNFEIIHADNAFLAQLAAGGNLLALDDLIEQYRDEFDLDDIAEGFWDLATIDGQIYGIPIIGNTMHLFYNPEILAEAGVDVPDSYEDVIAACPVLQDAGYAVPFTINLHADWAWTTEFSNFIKAWGGDILNEDSTPAFNSPEGVAAGEQMLEVVEACMGASGLQYSIDDTQAGLQTAELPMASTWASRAAAMDDPDASTIPGVIEFGPALRVSSDSVRTGPAYADFYTIPVGTEVDPEVIFRLILGATNLASQSAAAAEGIVPRESASNDAGPRDIPEAQQSIDEGVGPNSIDPALGVANAILGRWLLQIPDGLSVEDALREAEAEYLVEAESQGLL